MLLNDGTRLLVSLCVSRIPLKFTETSVSVRRRLWRRVWEQKTKNEPSLDESLVYMRLPTHFLSPKNMQVSEPSSTFSGSQLNSVKNTRMHQSSIDKQDVDKSSKSLNRLPDKLLHLIIRYRKFPNIWTFPFSDWKEKTSARNSLIRIANEMQIEPYFLNNCPAGVRKFPGNHGGGKIFYYRALHNTESSNAMIGESILDFAWVSAEELRFYLPFAAFAHSQLWLPVDE